MPRATTTLGWSLIDADTERGEIEVSFEATEDFLNPAGTVQGGFLTAMLDDTMGPALAATLDPGQYGTTIELKVSFLRPAKPGRLVGRGRIVHRGGTIAFLAGELLDESGQVVAVGSSTTRILKTG
ncbi:PaaI family thioesterase [Actinophytocola sp. KF-1]